MIKNQLYPFIEKYINEYLYGFTKEQLKVGVMNGIIALEGLNIRVDKVNEKLDDIDIPIWIKAGTIKKIRISCSLMNFIGEKPLDVNVEDIECVICPSFKWIIKNMSTFIEENDYYIKEPYDPTDNNSHDIFSRKINIYDSSVIKKEKFYEIFSDPSKLSQILSKIFTKCLKFYYQKAYLINLKIKNIHFRFEDDELNNIFSDIGLGFKISNLEVNLSAEGTKKKNNFKCENLNFYWEPKPNILIPTKKFRESFNDNKIDEKYYEYLKSVMADLRNQNYIKKIHIIENFNFMGNLGIHFIESGNIDLFSKREKNYKFMIQIATSELNLHIYPEILKISERLVDFMKSFYVIDPIQDFKPMRKPYNKLSELVKKMKGDKIFESKRKRLVRDWMFYLIWNQRFKNAIYGKAFTNPLFSEFSKYFNICVVPNTNGNPIGNNYPQINDSFYLKKNEISQIDDKNLLNITNQTGIKEDNLNPENINLTVVSDFLIKSVNFNIHSKHLNNKVHDYFLFKISGIEIRSMLQKDKFESSLEIKNLTVNNKIQYEINKNLDSKINEEIHSNDYNNFYNNANYDKASIYNSNNVNFMESERSLINNNKLQFGRMGTIIGNAITINNNAINDSFTSDIPFSSPKRIDSKNNEEHFMNFHHKDSNVSNMSNITNLQINSNNLLIENPKLNKKLIMISKTLDKIKDKQNSKNIKNIKPDTSFITFFLNEESNTQVKDNASIYSGINSTQNNYNHPNEVDYLMNQNQNANLSKMINEFNKNKLKQKNNTFLNNNIPSYPAALKIAAKASNLKNVPTTLVKSDTTFAIANVSKIEKKIAESTKNFNTGLVEFNANQNSNGVATPNSIANIKVPINFLEIIPLTSSNNISHNESRTAKEICLSIRLNKNIQNKKPNLAVSLNLGICRINLVDKILESALNLIFDYKPQKALNKKHDENDNSLLFTNKLLGIIDFKYERQIYDMKNFIIQKLKSKIQTKENKNSDNVEYLNYVKKEMDLYDYNYLQYGNFELNYLLQKFQTQNLELNLNINEVYIANLAFEDETQKNLIKYGKIRIPKNFMKFIYHPFKHLIVKFFDFEMEFSESERMRKILTDVSKIFEEKINNQLTGVNLLFRPVIKKFLEERRIAELEIKQKTDSRKFNNFYVEDENSKTQILNKKSSIKQIQSDFQKILNNNNMNLNNQLTNPEKLKNPFYEGSENTLTPSNISFEEEVELKLNQNKKKSSTNTKEIQNFKISDKIAEEDKSNKNEFVSKKTSPNIKTGLSNTNNNLRYEEAIGNPMKFSEESEFFYNHKGNEKTNDPTKQGKILLEEQADTMRAIPREDSTVKPTHETKKKSTENNNVYIGKYSK